MFSLEFNSPLVIKKLNLSTRDVNYTNLIRLKFIELLGDKCNDLICEGNKYYDLNIDQSKLQIKNYTTNFELPMGLSLPQP